LQQLERRNTYFGRERTRASASGTAARDVVIASTQTADQMAHGSSIFFGPSPVGPAVLMTLADQAPAFSRHFPTGVITAGAGHET
jgi:hypothetical protein